MLTRHCIFLGSVSVIFISIFLSPGSLIYAEGFRIFDQSASAAGQGGAFAAQADDPSAIHFNPAGMTQLRNTQISLGIVLTGGQTSFSNSSGVQTDGNLGGTVATPPPVNFFITSNLKDLGIDSFGDLTVGLGVTTPFGLVNEYPDNGPFNTVAISTELPLIDIKPTLAYKVNNWFSLGVGLDIYTFADFIGEGQLEQHRNSGPAFVPLGIPLGTPLELNGNGTAVGFNVGILYTPLRNQEDKPLLNLALVYRNKVTLDLEGEFLVAGSVVSGASTALHLPEIISGGLAYWPIRNGNREWKLEVDVDYADWSSADNIDVSLSIGPTIPNPLNWEETWVWMIGTEYKFLHLSDFPGWELDLRMGYTRSETPVPDRTFGPAVPDADFNTFSAGLGFSCSKQGFLFGLFKCGNLEIGMDLAYQAVVYDSRTISNNIEPTVNGTWDTIIHVGALNLNVNF
jgi:long-chain fatty acid transport protein